MMLQKSIFTSIIIFIFIFIFFSYEKKQPISRGPFQALKCESLKDKVFDVYIFNKNNGYLYFYNKSDNTFQPLTEKIDAGYYSHLNPEIYSFIKNKKLIIKYLEYNDNKQEYIKIQKIINLNSLKQVVSYNNKKIADRLLKINCSWVDPKLGI